MALIDTLGEIPDPRRGNAQRHELLDILAIALVASVCGAESCVDFAEFAEDREPLLREFLGLKNGLPSHDTFSRLFRLLDPEQFRTCFQRFMARSAEACQGAKPMVDGDHGRIETRTAMVSTDIAWLQEQHAWPGLVAVGKIQRGREMPGKTTSETAYL